jgi:2-desacetyl-2-hydroxyethyl bacteriochlorophyllide A dehydrogenase
MHSLPETMRAALFDGAGSVRLAEVPVPRPEPDQVVVRVEAAGICGSDLHSYRGRSLRRRFDDWCALGLADGHELAGRVVATGAAVGDLAIGTRVTAEAVWHCGTCRQCASGQYHLCLGRQDLAWRGHGGFAELAFLPRRAVIELPPTLAAAEGALVEPLAAAVHAVHRAGTVLGQTVLVVGAGTIGCLAAAVARHAGARAVAVVARHPHQAEMASALGASMTMTERQGSVEAMRAAATSVGFDATIETTGSAEGFQIALQGARKGGAVVLAGGYPAEVTVNLGAVVGLELSILGSLCYGWRGVHRDLETAVHLIAGRQIPVRRVVTHTLPFADVAEAFRLAADKASRSVKVQITHAA